MLKKIALIIVILLALQKDCFSGETPSKELFHVNLSGSAVYVDRSNKFKIANTGHWTNRFNRIDGGEKPLEYDIDSWGGGYGIEAVLPEDDGIGLEFLFDQFFLLKNDKKTVPGVAAGELAVMPFIDGTPHGRNQTYGFFIASGMGAGNSSPGSVDLKYKLNYYSISINSVIRAVNSKHLNLDIVSGPVYARFAQDFEIRTSGTEASGSGMPTTSDTDEKLIDHLFGGRLGARAIIPLSKKLSLSASQICDLFLRTTYFDGKQEINNASGATGLVNFTRLTKDIDIERYQAGITPRFQTRVSMNYEITSCISASIFYNFESWLNLSRVENSIVTANLTALINGPTNIKSDNIASHEIGGKIKIVF